MRDAAHNQHSKTRPPERSRPHHNNRAQPVSSPLDADRVGWRRDQKCCAELMSVSVAGIPKNRCRTTVVERMGETQAELPFIGDQVGCLSHD